MRDQLKAPEILVEAAKRGERIRSPHARRSDTTGTHLRRFSTAIAVYACIAVLLLVSVTFLPVLLQSDPGDQHSETTPIGSAPTTTPTTTPYSPTTTTRPTTTYPPFTTDPSHIPATPMTNEDVENHMNSHTLLNDKIDPNSFFSSNIGFLADGGMANLFDDIFTAEEWQKAEQEGRFEAATYTDRVDTNNDGVIGFNEETGETDRWVELGQMSYDINSFALHWSMTEPVTLGSYVLYTGKNAESSGHNPVGWTLYATNDDALAAKPADTIPYLGISASALKNPQDLEAAGWVRIDYVFDSNMTDINFAPHGYKIDEENQKAYKHYCWFLDYPGEDGSIVSITGLKLYAAENAASGDAPSPDTLYDALLNSNDVTVSAQITTRSDGKESSSQTIHERSGNKVKLTARSALSETVGYIDMTNGLQYYTSDEGGWLAKGSSYSYWDWVLEDYFFEADPELLFDSDRYTESGGVYTMTSAAAAEMSEKLAHHWEFADTFGESASFGATIEHSDGTWIIQKTITNADGSVSESVEYTVTFGSRTIALPDEKGNDGEFDPDRLLSPSEFCDALYGDADMTVTFESGGRVEFVRSGDKVKQTATTSTGERITYYDFGAGKMYTEGENEGEWAVTAIVSDWQGLVDSGIFGEVWEDFERFGCYIEVMFADVNFTLADGRYVATEAFKQQCLEEGKAHCSAGDEYFTEWYGEAPTYEATFDYENGVHTFGYRFIPEDGEALDEMILTLAFGDSTVELPDAVG